MNYSEAIIAMESFFNTQWNGETPIVWGADDPAKSAEQETWVRFNIRHSDGGQATMGAPGANKFRQIGIITIQIFQPEGKYGKFAKDVANSIIDIYQGTENGGITYQKVRADEVGNDGFGWYQINVIAEFYYDTIT